MRGRPSPRQARRGNRPGRPAGSAARLVEVEIEAIGGRGDGIARLDGESLFVPFTAHGDRVVARIEGRRGDGFAGALVETLRPGPQRAEPPCAHFGTCGGCAAQHLAPEAQAAWKRDMVATALARQGLDAATVAPAVVVPPASRRRAGFAFVRGGGGVVLGFNARATHRIVDIAECPVLEPALAALLPALRTLLAGLVPPGGRGDVEVALLDGGIDVTVATDLRLELRHHEMLAAFADTADLCRLSWRRPGEEPEPVAQRRPAAVQFAGVPVEVPPGAFLQPSRAGEAAITELVLAATVGAARVLELFAGCGTLTFPLARRARVHAVEGEGAALRALKSAADRAGLDIATEARDLARRPLGGSELRGFDAVVFDPPRTGAPQQAAALAEAGPPVVVGVSCHAASFAKDARLLTAGGYALDSVVPVDQFAWAPHVEMVGVFRR